MLVAAPPLQDLAQLAWNYMNDGLRTSVFLKYKAHIIACAVLQLGASKLGEFVDGAVLVQFARFS